MPGEQSDVFDYKEGVMKTLRMRRKASSGGRSGRHACRPVVAPTEPVIYFAMLTSQFSPYYRHQKLWPRVLVLRQYRKVDPSFFFFWHEITEN
jgi:hypothetical protein